MPDQYGLPTASDCAIKLTRLSPVGLTADLAASVEDILPGVIAEFQSPPGPGGGTGRSFTPVVATRLYDGNGYAELTIEDVVPGSSLVVLSYTAPLTDVILKRSDPNDGWNVLVRPGSAGFFGGYYAGNGALFALGKQNISVTTTFGFAATAPRDVYLAILNEVCYRALVEDISGLDGQGETIQMGSFKFSTGSNSRQTEETSSLTVMHRTYLAAKHRYRLRQSRKLKELAGRMA